MPIIARGEFLESSGAVLIARVWDEDGVDITQADISAIAGYGYKLVNGVWTIISAYNGVSIEPEDVVFNTLQSAPSWDPGGSGYNLRIVIPYTLFDTAGTQYRFNHKLTPVSGQQVYVQHQGQCLGLTT
jgi:hypothetical protein